jgi:15-cis-phytoene synthase
MSGDAPELVLRECRRILEQNSKSFALAARLLPPESRDRAAAVYAFCRRVDDAIDGAPAEQQPDALAGLHRELDAVYGDGPLHEPALRAFRAVVATCAMPRRYPAELVEGMAMDVRDTHYETLEDLLLYCHRVAGVVGLMMCHVFGVSRDDALTNAAHLGIAMQLTNICRDVEEDWSLGRLYLPAALLRGAGARDFPAPGNGTLPSQGANGAAVRAVVRDLLAIADRYYASADLGIPALPFRAGLAVRAARKLYHAIGLVIADRAYDPLRGRAVVAKRRKLELIGATLARHAAGLPELALDRVRTKSLARPPRRELSFPEDVLP